MHIVITRPKEDSSHLIENLIKLGHAVTHLPVIKIEKLEKSFKKLTTDTVKGFLADSKKSKFKI